MNSNLGSLEDIAELYEKEMKPLLKSDQRKEILEKYVELFDKVDPVDKSTHTIPTDPIEATLKKIVLMTISETSKDFTLIFNVQEVALT